jgi:hypothetical protein
MWYEALQFLETGNGLPFGKVLPVLATRARNLKMMRVGIMCYPTYDRSGVGSRLQ